MAVENKHFWKEFSGCFLYDSAQGTLRFTAKGKKELWPQLNECGIAGSSLQTMEQFKRAWYELCLFRINRAQLAAVEHKNTTPSPQD